MKIKHFLACGLVCLAAAFPSFAASTDSEGYPVMHLAGAFNGWNQTEGPVFQRQGDVYSLTVAELNGQFKITNDDWTFNYGLSLSERVGDISTSTILTVVNDGANISASNLRNVTLQFTIAEPGESTKLSIIVDGQEPVEQDPSGISGTLPVIYINVYEPESSDYDNEIISPELDHKNYFTGEYWLDTKGCAWLEDLGAKNVGSADAPLPLQIKARGNYTRKAYSKKPFKLKLDKKQALLGLSKSKHFALLAHADDNYGYMRNFTGFNLGKRIGLPWTPWQQPVEVVINGDYRGLYFLTESIRVDEDRVNITELDDNVSEPALISGGYIVELDNYDEENQIRMPEASCAHGHYLDMLRVTWDTPEEYSDLQKRFITDQFTTMNNAVGANSDELWKYMDLDDAARYYLVEEIISHCEAYHGSTYLFRDRGEGQKWHFSPLWDCGNGFNGPMDNFFYEGDPFGNTWIPSMRQNETFNRKVRETWMWFMSNKYAGLDQDLAEYAAHLKAAAQADHKRWANVPTPSNYSGMPVVNNVDMDSRLQAVLHHLNEKTRWLCGQFGDYTALSTPAAEPARDETPAAALPSYAREPNPEEVHTVYFNNQDENWEQIYCYIYDPHPTLGLMQPLGVWPGQPMEAVTRAATGMWKFSFIPEYEFSDGMRIMFNDGKGGQGHQTSELPYLREGIYSNDGSVTGVDNISVEDAGEAVYYNLQGIRVDNPRAGGILIRKSASGAATLRF